MDSLPDKFFSELAPRNKDEFIVGDPGFNKSIMAQLVATPHTRVQKKQTLKSQLLEVYNEHKGHIDSDDWSSRLLAIKNSIDLVLSLMYVKTNAPDVSQRSIIKEVFMELMGSGDIIPLTYRYYIFVRPLHYRREGFLWDYNLIRILAQAYPQTSHHESQLREWISFLTSFREVDYFERDDSKVRPALEKAVQHFIKEYRLDATVSIAFS